MLQKNVLKHAKKRVLQVILLFFIMVMSSFIFVVMSHSISALKTPTEAFFNTYNQEDFHVVVSDALSQSDHNALHDFTYSAFSLSELKRENKAAFDALVAYRENAFMNRFDHTLIEARLHKDMMFDVGSSQHFMRILKDGKVINQSYITQGTKPSLPHEIALVEVYAKANNLTLGDTFTINNETYTITGFVLFPDYTLALFQDAFILNNAMRTLALLTDEAFDALEEPVFMTLAGVSTSGSLSDTYFSNPNLDFVLHTSLTVNTLRSGAIYDELAGAEAMSLILSLVIASVGVIITAVMVSRMLDEQRGAIGVLKALGYKNEEIAWPYLLFVLVLSLPGLLIGYLLGLYLASPMTLLYASIYLLPHDPITFTPVLFMQSIVLPLAFLGLMGYIVILRLLRQDPLVLIRPSVTHYKRVGKKRLPFIHRLSLLKRVKHAYIWRHRGRLAVFFTGVFTSIFLIFTALSMVNLFDHMFYDYYDSIEVSYMAYCPTDDVCERPDFTHDRVLELPHVRLDQLHVMVIGLDASNSLHPLYEKNKEITHKLDEPGVIITRAIAMQLRLKVHDSVSITYGVLTQDFPVVGITDELGSQKVYVNRRALSLLLTDGQDSETFNVIYSLERPTGNYLTIMSVEALLEQSKDLSQMMYVMTLILTFASVSMGVVILLLILLLSIEHYHYDISLFKVMGYTNKEIRRLFIHSYLSYLLFIFILTYPISLISFEIMMWYMASQYGMIFPMILSVEHVVYALVISLSIFFLSLPLATKKIQALSLAEALKITQNDY